MSALSQPPPAPPSLAQKANYLAIEYKHLLTHSPGGVYLLPSPTTQSHFVGVIFIRRGVYQNGIYKFTLTCPVGYNDVNKRPVINFTTPLLNPLVDPESNELDLTGAFPTWDPTRHYLITALTYLKKIFYLKSYNIGTTPDNTDFLGNNSDNITLPHFPNMAAIELQGDPAAFRQAIVDNVNKSQQSVYENASADGSQSFTFSKAEAGAHDLLKSMLYSKGGEEGERIGAEGVLDCVKEAQVKSR